MIAQALVRSLQDRSLWSTLPQNIVAGITVGIVALPLSMGLAIASGVAPQHGLYTAIIGGIFIALLGGSRVNISGPTAAFVVVLLPVVQEYGLGGLLVSGLLAGLMMIGFGLLRFGRLIEVIPYPVVVGFTAGIGTVIACYQLKDFLGLQPVGEGVYFIERAAALVEALPTLRWQELLIGCLTLTVLIVWKRVPSRIPAYLVALLLGGVMAWVFNALPALPEVATIASRFSFEINGAVGAGIPPVAPQWTPPWQLPDATGEPIGLSFALVRTLLGAAFAIALLGALESLLCAVVADGMTGQRHDPDSELIGQGLGNVVVAFFAGIPVTAAIARTALNVRSGGTTPAAAVVHGLFVLLAMLLLAPWLSLIPMASMAAVLMMVAWNMSEAPHAWRIIRRSPAADAAVFFACYGLTVLIDMQVAVAGGVALASILFIRRMIELTETSLASGPEHVTPVALPGVVVYEINGPLFFGAAHKALKVIAAVDKQIHTVVLDFSRVNLLDTTAMMNLESIATALAHRRTAIYLIHVKPKLAGKMERYGLFNQPDRLQLAPDLAAVEERLQRPRAAAGESLA